MTFGTVEKRRELGSPVALGRDRIFIAAAETIVSRRCDDVSNYSEFRKATSCSFWRSVSFIEKRWL